MISNEQFGKTVHGGDLPEEVPHDNGYGTKTIYPKMACPACPANFWNDKNLNVHIKERHNNGEVSLFD